MPLVLCKTVNGGLLRDAATKKKDDRILLQIMGKDCVVIEVRYHRKCYTNYTNFLRRPDRKASGSAPYDAGYEQFCKEVVDVLIKNKELISSSVIDFGIDSTGLLVTAFTFSSSDVLQ